MPRYSINVNGKTHNIDVSADTPLLWVLRDHLDLKGTKYGCGIALCGTCTILFNGAAVRSCSIPVSAVGNAKIVTIEGLSGKGDHPVQKAWKEADVPQCGYCHSGQIMAAVALLNSNSNPSREDIDNAMAGLLCRCGTYLRVRKAIRMVAEKGGEL